MRKLKQKKKKFQHKFFGENMMKNTLCIYRGIRVTFVALICITMNSILVNAQTGPEWIQMIDDAESVDHSYSEGIQTITTASGKERTLEMKSWSAEGGDVSLMIYTGPARVKGDKILIRDGGDNIWYYMRRRDVTRHFTGNTRRQKAMGSDFSYQDLSQGDMVEDYNAEVMGSEVLNGTDCIKLKCTPTDSGPSYDYIIIWAAKEDNITRQIEYYDGDGLLKTLYIKDIQEVEGRKTGLEMEMVNSREGSKTVIKNSSITFSNEVNMKHFTKAALGEEL
jgi:outer membrane lipoprotein-sorting protein